MNATAIDTNVLLHCDNSAIEYCDSANELINRFKMSDCLLAIDDGYCGKECTNTSWIVSEYLRFLYPGSKGYALLLYLVAEDRLLTIQKSGVKRIKPYLTRMIRDKTDIVFVMVASAPDSKLLISNDYEDLQESKRSDLRKKYGIRICNSMESEIPG